MHNEIINSFVASKALNQSITQDGILLKKLEQAIVLITETYAQSGKVLFCGNGGSAADAQHLAAELSGRFYFNRPPLNAEALHVNSSFVTAVANDMGFDQIFARMVKALGHEGDILIVLSTSGNSPNIIKAVKQALELKMKVIGFTGKTGGEIANDCDILINVPSSDTPRIQEMHILMGHILCQQVEKIIFKQYNNSDNSKV